MMVNYEASNDVGVYQNFESGVSAYKNGDFDLAADCFRIAVRVNPENWDAQFFLAMSLAQSTQVAAAAKIFMTIAESCPDETFRRRARLARQALVVWRQ